MNPAELRYEIFRAMQDLKGDHEIQDVALVSPESVTEALKLRVTALDPFGRPRRYVVTVAEE